MRRVLGVGPALGYSWHPWFDWWRRDVHWGVLFARHWIGDRDVLLWLLWILKGGCGEKSAC
jgi:hypothetical protein